MGRIIGVSRYVGCTMVLYAFVTGLFMQIGTEGYRLFRRLGRAIFNIHFITWNIFQYIDYDCYR